MKIQKFKKFIKKEVVVDFLTKSLVILISVYLLLFAAEAILPEVIVKTFNFNFLLALIFLILLVLSFNKKGRIEAKGVKKFTYFFVIFFALVILVVLYKATIVQSLIYLFLAVTSGYLFYRIVE